MFERRKGFRASALAAVEIARHLRRTGVPRTRARRNLAWAKRLHEFGETALQFFVIRRTLFIQERAPPLRVGFDERGFVRESVAYAIVER